MAEGALQLVACKQRRRARGRAGMIQARSVAGLMMDHRRWLATLVNCEKAASLWHLWNLSPTTARKLTKHAFRVLGVDNGPPSGLKQ